MPPAVRFREEAQADLPSLTLGGAWRWTPGGHNKWRIGADAGYFKANINDIDGDVTFGRIGVEFFPWERSGFSLDYTMSKITVDANQVGLHRQSRFHRQRAQARIRLPLVIAPRQHPPDPDLIRIKSADGGVRETARTTAGSP